ncbi:hypothetical protein VULLAG_LOCUS14262 [Vulpes lagopus]
MRGVESDSRPQEYSPSMFQGLGSRSQLVGLTPPTTPSLVPFLPPPPLSPSSVVFPRVLSWAPFHCPTTPLPPPYPALAWGLGTGSGPLAALSHMCSQGQVANPLWAWRWSQSATLFTKHLLQPDPWLVLKSPFYR